MSNKLNRISSFSDDEVKQARTAFSSLRDNLSLAELCCLEEQLSVYLDHRMRLYNRGLVDSDSKVSIQQSTSFGCVKHGHWFITEYEYLDCSVCGHSFYTGCESTAEANQLLADGDTPNYCPHCGAKMDELGW